MRVLVTGAAGLIGSAVAMRLQAEHEVIGLDLNAGPHVEVIGDCLDVAKWRHRIGQLDAIVHTAALHVPHIGQRSNEEFGLVNVEATSRLIDLAMDAGARRFVLTSTTSLYGHALEGASGAVWVDEQLEPQPRDIYDETKLEAERLVALAGDSMTVTSLRMSRCFPEPADVMAWYRLYRGIDRRDVAKAHALALCRNGPPATYVISSSTPFRREDCEDLLVDVSSAVDRRCPGLIAEMASRGLQPPRSIDRVYDVTLARHEIGFIPLHGIESCLAGDWDPFPSG
jgi:nucleoside-diphosphate-sugar epimerase